MPSQTFQCRSVPGPRARPVFDQPNLIHDLPILETKGKGSRLEESLEKEMGSDDKLSLATTEEGERGLAILSST